MRFARKSTRLKTTSPHFFGPASWDRKSDQRVLSPRTLCRPGRSKNTSDASPPSLPDHRGMMKMCFLMWYSKAMDINKQWKPPGTIQNIFKIGSSRRTYLCENDVCNSHKTTNGEFISGFSHYSHYMNKPPIWSINANYNPINYHIYIL